jgi:CelD/BcsL family acetyltransferase involved in cellulose biosynthesis
MRVDIIDKTEALAALQADWDAVYGADPEAQFFLSWTWMSKWLAAIGNPWFILAARPDAESSAYVAFFPLWLGTKERKSGGFHNDIYMGGNYTADYTGFVCAPDFQEQAIPAFASRVKQLNWTHFRLEFLRASDHRTALFMQEFSTSEFAVAELDRVEKDNVDNSICPFVRLPGDWDAYLDGRLSANSRQKIRRILRQIENSDAFRITHAGRETLERDIDILLRFWAERWGAQKGAKLNAILKNYRLMLRHAFEAGALFLPVLWQGERPIGALAILADVRKKSFLFFVGGRDETFDGLPAGLALHGYSIRHAIRHGFVTYDFLRGNEPYKYSFGAEEYRVTSFVLTTKDEKNLGGRLDRRSLPFALERSLEHHRAGRSLEAELGFRQVLDLEPQNADALYGLGQIMAKRGEHPAAMGLLKTLLAARPDTKNAWFWLARSLRARGEFAPAAVAYCEGIERQPAIPGAYYDLGHLLLSLGQYDQAAAAFEAVRGLQADFPDNQASLTKALRLRGGLSPEDLARRASAHAGLRDKVGKLSAIAGAADRYRAATNETAVAARTRDSAAPPLLSHGDADRAGRAVLEARPRH